tara:strand:+ start:1979 stop:2500 length:522 start_codon:yes stop_codon:yes gene_type:complete
MRKNIALNNAVELIMNDRHAYRIRDIPRILNIPIRRLRQYIDLEMIKLAQLHPGTGNHRIMSAVNVVEAAVLEEVQTLGVTPAKLKLIAHDLTAAVRESLSDTRKGDWQAYIFDIPTIAKIVRKDNHATVLYGTSNKVREEAAIIVNLTMITRRVVRLLPILHIETPIFFCHE